MSLFSWLFPGKTKTAERHPAAPARATSSPSKDERTQRREQLYLAVRDTMVRSAVLSSGYKFKVLSLDAEGRQFLVMVDIAPGYGADTGHQAEMENLLMHTAKARFHVEVSAVYWRLNPTLAGPEKPVGATPMVAQAPLAPPQAAPTVAPTQLSPEPVQTATPAPGGTSDFEPIAPDEFEAFKRALQTAAPSPAPTLPSATVAPKVQPGIADNTGGSGFADTLIVDEEERAQRLGATQYGELR